MKYNFNYCWHFLLADAFPMRDALSKWRDGFGRYFYEKEYQEDGWQEVTLPHTFNDGDLFVDRIQDAGSGQKRTCAFYRKFFSLEKDEPGSKILLEFEGLRQTCYLYVNGRMAGYYEAGVAPFGFDITPYVEYGGENLIALVTDNTATRNIGLCIAETPNLPGAEPGAFWLSQDRNAPEEHQGVGFFWNCNDFNPSVGGITRPVYLHVKPRTYLTLPLYSNLQTRGAYVYASDYDLEKGRARIHVEAELRNESGREREAWLEVSVERLDGTRVAAFSSEPIVLAPVEAPTALSITPGDAYGKEVMENGRVRYIPREEEETAPTETDSLQVQVLQADSEMVSLRFWNIEDPYLYRVKVELWSEGKAIDQEILETGFRKVEYDKDRGVMINGHSVWLTGYAQRASNEWAAIGITPEWLKDQDAIWMKESNANHIRWMHVAASLPDIRSCDRHGIVCTQPAGDKEAESFGRQWDQRVELMRDIIIAFRNHPSILFWEAGNNSISQKHMREMTDLKRLLDPKGGRFMGCRTLNTQETAREAEYVGTMLNRHGARFLAEMGPVMETEYSREEAPRRVWDDYTPPDYDYRNLYMGKGGKKQPGRDFWDLTMEELMLAEAEGYEEFFHDRVGGASGKDIYSAAAALCWTDSAQHGRQAATENGRMSGRVDSVRIPKQNFALYQVMQSREPRVKILGHWNYPEETDTAYRYPVKRFNGDYWEETGEYARRDPRRKTVYVAGSYDILRMELWINGEKAGVSVDPVHSFLFPFEGIDITRRGKVEAVGYDRHGMAAARDMLCTVGEPVKLRLALHTSPAGFLADGADIAYLDVEVLDSEGRLCPLCDSRIDFETEGEARFLGGYNSGRFNGYGREDSVIHQNHVYAECGCNRVFLRSTFYPGKVRVKAVMEGVPEVTAVWESLAVEREPISRNPLIVRYADYLETSPQRTDAFPAIPEADALKYHAPDQDYCKILVRGQEPDNKGVPSVNKNGSVWGSVLVILDRMRSIWKDLFRYEFNLEAGRLTVISGGDIIVAESGKTHLLINGQESLMDGAPYVTELGAFVMEVNALVPHIRDISCQYDDRVHVLRITYAGEGGDIMPDRGESAGRGLR